MMVNQSNTRPNLSQESQMERLVVRLESCESHADMLDFRDRGLIEDIRVGLDSRESGADPRWNPTEYQWRRLSKIFMRVN